MSVAASANATNWVESLVSIDVRDVVMADVESIADVLNRARYGGLWQALRSGRNTVI